MRASPVRCHQKAAPLGSSTPLEAFLKQLLRRGIQAFPFLSFSVAQKEPHSPGKWSGRMYVSSSFRWSPK